MPRSIFLFVLLCVCVSGFCKTLAEERRPNIVLIMADDLGYECIGANGGTALSARKPAGVESKPWHTIS